MYRTPYFLSLLVEQVDALDDFPEGLAALFTGYVRESLRDWRSPTALPKHGVLVPALSRPAFEMQSSHESSESSQLRIEYGDTCTLVGQEPEPDIVKASVALNLLRVFVCLLKDNDGMRSCSRQIQNNLVVFILQVYGCFVWGEAA